MLMKLATWLALAAMYATAVADVRILRSTRIELVPRAGLKHVDLKSLASRNPLLKHRALHVRGGETG
jgi:hypothetical protein